MIVHPLNFYLEIRANVLSNHQLGLLERFDFTHNEKTEIIEGGKGGGNILNSSIFSHVCPGLHYNPVTCITCDRDVVKRQFEF